MVSSLAMAQDAVPWVGSLEDAQQIAGQRGQLILLHFYGDNCPPCKALEANVFPKPEFARGLTANYVPVKINASQNRQLAARYGVDRWPTDVVVTADGTPITKPAVCPQDSNKYLANLDQIAALHRVRMDPSAQVTQNVAYNQSPNASRYQPQAPPEGNTFGAVPVSAPAQYAQNTDPRLAGNVAQAPVQQQPAYDPRGYQPQETQLKGVDLRSGFQPAAGQGYAPPADQNRSMYPNQQMPLADNPRGMQSETSNAVYGGLQRSQYAPQSEPRYDVRLSEPSPGTPVQNAVTQPASDAGRSQFQTNNYTAGNVAPASAASSPIGLEGYCPVALTEAAKWAKGDARFGAIHRGRTYLFSTQAEQQRFMANPDKYSPMLSGFDAVKYIEQGVLVDGKRQHGIVHEGQMYLFADEAALDKFCKAPNSYCTPVRQAMQQSVTPNSYR